MSQNSLTKWRTCKKIFFVIINYSKIKTKRQEYTYRSNRNIQIDNKLQSRIKISKDSSINYNEIKFKESYRYGLSNIACTFLPLQVYFIRLPSISQDWVVLLNSGLKDVITRMATLGIIFLNRCYYANPWKGWKHA